MSEQAKKPDPNSWIGGEVAKEEAAKKKNSRLTRRIIAAVVVLILLLTGGCLAYQHFHPGEGVMLEESVKAELGQLENKSNEEIKAELNRVVEEGSMAISINVNPVFSSGDAEGSLRIENSPANKYAQEVVITLNETGEEIYRSGLILPNHHIQTDKLAVDLEAGEYEGTALFTAYEKDESDEWIAVGSASALIKISVLS